MKLKIIFIAICMISVLSCKDQEQQEKEAIETTNPAEGTTAEKLEVNPAHGLPGHRCDLPVGAPLAGDVVQQEETQVDELPATSVSPIRVNQRPEVNPPHGEPYHDCSIPVGAELKKS